MSGLFGSEEVPETVPLWQEMRNKHRIQSIHDEEAETEAWTAKSQTAYAYAVGDTEREAVVSLIHQLKLPGWEKVSVKP